MGTADVNEWFDKGDWKNGLTLSPHPSINKVAFAYQYAANKPLWDKTFEFLRTTDLTRLAPGDHPLAGDSVVVKVSYGRAKEESLAKWETHRKFIDVQLVAEGSEKIGISDLKDASLTIPYNEMSDVAHYNAAGTYHTAAPGTFFIFFPQDVHRPGIIVDEGNVRKIVVKIRAAE